MSRTPGSLQLERFVNEFITRYGTPRQVHTDQGTNFQSHLFQEMCELLGVDKTRTTAFHPASDGLVERFNRTMECMLSMYVAEDQRDWDLRLSCLLMAYRGTPQESTQCSPNVLMLGRETELPIDLMYGTPKLVDETIDPRDRDIYYVDMMRDRLEMAHAHARRSLQNSAVRQKRNYDHKVYESQFNRGDQVWLFTPGRKVGMSPKLQTFWDGPYTILERLWDVV